MITIKRARADTSRIQDPLTVELVEALEDASYMLCLLCEKWENCPSKKEANAENCDTYQFDELIKKATGGFER
jgi:hypothetical protein